MATTAAPETLNEVAVLRQQAQMAHQVVRMNTAGITHEESLGQPQPEGNCMNFVLGHLVNIYDQALRLVGQEPVLGAEALHRYRRGAPPLTDPAEALPFDQLLAAWDTASERFAAGLATLTPEALERPMPGPTVRASLPRPFGRCWPSSSSTRPTTRARRACCAASSESPARFPDRVSRRDKREDAEENLPFSASSLFVSAPSA